MNQSMHPYRFQAPGPMDSTGHYFTAERGASYNNQHQRPRRKKRNNRKNKNRYQNHDSAHNNVAQEKPSIENHQRVESRPRELSIREKVQKALDNTARIDRERKEEEAANKRLACHPGRSCPYQQCRPTTPSFNTRIRASITWPSKYNDEVWRKISNWIRNEPQNHECCIQRWMQTNDPTHQYVSSLLHQHVGKRCLDIVVDETNVNLVYLFQGDDNMPGLLEFEDESREWQLVIMVFLCQHFPRRYLELAQQVLDVRHHANSQCKRQKISDEMKIRITYLLENRKIYLPLAMQTLTQYSSDSENEDEGVPQNEKLGSTSRESENSPSKPTPIPATAMLLTQNNQTESIPVTTSVFAKETNTRFAVSTITTTSEGRSLDCEIVSDLKKLEEQPALPKSTTPLAEFTFSPEDNKSAKYSERVLKTSSEEAVSDEDHSSTHVPFRTEEVSSLAYYTPEELALESNGNPTTPKELLASTSTEPSYVATEDSTQKRTLTVKTSDLIGVETRSPAALQGSSISPPECENRSWNDSHQETSSAETESPGLVEEHPSSSHHPIQEVEDVSLLDRSSTENLDDGSVFPLEQVAFLQEPSDMKEESDSLSLAIDFPTVPEESSDSNTINAELTESTNQDSIPANIITTPDQPVTIKLMEDVSHEDQATLNNSSASEDQDLHVFASMEEVTQKDQKNGSPAASVVYQTAVLKQKSTESSNDNTEVVNRENADTPTCMTDRTSHEEQQPADKDIGCSQNTRNEMAPENFELEISLNTNQKLEASSTDVGQRIDDDDKVGTTSDVTVMKDQNDHQDSKPQSSRISELPFGETPLIKNRLKRRNNSDHHAIHSKLVALSEPASVPVNCASTIPLVQPYTSRNIEPCQPDPFVLSKGIKFDFKTLEEYYKQPKPACALRNCVNPCDGLMLSRPIPAIEGVFYTRFTIPETDFEKMFH